MLNARPASFSKPQTPALGALPPTFRVGVLTLVNLMQVNCIPHGLPALEQQPYKVGSVYTFCQSCSLCRSVRDLENPEPLLQGEKIRPTSQEALVTRFYQLIHLHLCFMCIRLKAPLNKCSWLVNTGLKCTVP